MLGLAFRLRNYFLLAIERVKWRDVSTTTEVGAKSASSFSNETTTSAESGYRDVSDVPTASTTSSRPTPGEPGSTH
jgi:hypothetical protein